LKSQFDAAMCRLGLIFYPDPQTGLGKSPAHSSLAGGLGTLILAGQERNPCITTPCHHGHKTCRRQLRRHGMSDAAQNATQRGGSSATGTGTVAAATWLLAREIMR
jgi:hypothetical protein